MSIDGIKIGLNEVKATGQTIRRLNVNLNDRLDQIKSDMNALESAWQSDASQTIRANFNKMLPQFEEYRKIIESYAKFLDETANIYDTTENAINNNASAFL
ncbi:MAG: pore-forming ESAT-6 family protein [Clostridium sp.]